MKCHGQVIIALGITVIGLMVCGEPEVPPAKLSRGQIDKMLEDLVWKQIQGGRKSYPRTNDHSNYPDAIDYVCPQCKTETRLLSDKVRWLYGFEETYRQYMTRIEERLDATFDETDFCSQCRKDKTKYSSFLYIEVRLGERTKRTWIEYGSDLSMLAAFLDGEDAYADDAVGNKWPLVFRIARIAKILGIEDSDTLASRLQEKMWERRQQEREMERKEKEAIEQKEQKDVL